MIVKSPRKALLVAWLAFGPALVVGACSNDDSSSPGGGGGGDSGQATGDTGTTGSDGASGKDGTTGGDGSTGSDGSAASTQCPTAANGTFSGSAGSNGNQLYASGYSISYDGITSPTTGNFSVHCALDDAGLVSAIPCTVGTPVMHDFTADHKSMTFTVTSLDGGTAVVSGAVGDD